MSELIVSTVILLVFFMPLLLDGSANPGEKLSASDKEDILIKMINRSDSEDRTQYLKEELRNVRNDTNN